MRRLAQVLPYVEQAAAWNEFAGGGNLRLSAAGNPSGVVDVTGKITVDGAPVEGIVVTTSPVNPIKADGTSQRPASGLTQADGTFRVVTPGAKMAGVTPGE